MTHLTHLLRLHQPTGIYLLLWPTLAGTAMGSGGVMEYAHLLALTLGVIVMRSAGCIMNDITDRTLDAQVERTKNRPLASGAISIPIALLVLAALLLAALMIALTLSIHVLIWALIAVPFIIAYPWMKRITHWPQLFLGITFNWGLIVGWVASGADVTLAAWLLYAGCIFWTLGYDSIYALQDRDDDTLIGIKSTARRIAGKEKQWIAAFYAIALLLWALCGWAHGSNLAYFGAIILLAFDFALQLKRLDPNNATICARIFRHNGIVGALLWLGVWLDKI